MKDQILVSNLELKSRIGITEEERSVAQRLTVSMVLFPAHGFASLDDKIENTVDYAQVCTRVVALAAAKPRNLVETLVEEIAELLLAEFRVAAVEIELRKYILVETEYVAVKIRREKYP